MAAVRQFLNELNKPIVLLKWKVTVDSHLFFSTTILIYAHKRENGTRSEEEMKLKSTTEGVVHELLVKEGDVVEPGTPLLILQSCNHNLILKEICAQCGADLWRSGMSQNLPETELVVTPKQAQKLEKAGEDVLLKKRKLALLICLDEILTETINSVSAKETNDANICKPKVRSGAQNFLHKLCEYYELHLCTSGSLRYASRALKILDPNGRSGAKIWAQNSLSKCTADSMKSIFPHGDSMVCIVACEDGSGTVPLNVININPSFCCMPCIGSTACNTVTDGNGNVQEIAAPPRSKQTSDSTETRTNPSSSQQQNNNNNETVTYSNNKVQTHSLAVASPDRKKLDSDLYCLERILVNIHKGYYSLCDQMARQKMYIINQEAIPDLKHVIPYVRQNVLKGVNIVFSGLVPAGADVDKMPLCMLAKSMGANVSENVILHEKANNTTHIIAHRLGTEKTKNAKKFKNVFVITPEWLLYCEKCWEKVDERLFLLKKEKSKHNQQKEDATDTESLPGFEATRKCLADDLPHNEDSCSSTTSNESTAGSSLLSAALNLTSQELKEMSNEVEEECVEDSDDDNEETSSKRRVSDRFLCWPSPPKKRRKCTTDIGTLPPVWGSNGKLRSISLPVWERPWENDNFDESGSDNDMHDYIYSDDENYICSDDDDCFV